MYCRGPFPCALNFHLCVFLSLPVAHMHRYQYTTLEDRLKTGISSLSRHQFGLRIVVRRVSVGPAPLPLGFLFLLFLLEENLLNANGGMDLGDGWV